MRTKKKNAAAAPGKTHPPVPFSVFADCIETLSDMLNGCGPIELYLTRLRMGLCQTSGNCGS